MAVTMSDIPTAHRTAPRAVITPRRIVISLLLAGCAVGLWYGATIGGSSSKAIVYSDPAVKSLTPQPGDAAPRQARIGATLYPAYTLATENTNGMAINGEGIPQDQLEIIPGLNQFFFTPGPGKEMSALPAGRNCVTLIIKRTTDPTDNGHPFSWCFQSQ